MRAISRLKCAVVTCFAEGQPGYLDFSYRVRALARHHDTTVISNLDLEMPEFDIPELTKVRLPMGQGQLQWLKYLWRCWRWLATQKWDVVVFLNSATAPIGAVWRGSPALVYWNEHPTHLAPPTGLTLSIKGALRAGLRGLMFAGAKAATTVMPIGEAHRDDLLLHGCPPSRVTMIYMGVDKRFRASLPRADRHSENVLKLVYVGSILKERGRDVMLEAMARLAQDPVMRTAVHLTLVGAPPDQLAYCQKRIEALGITQMVTMVGRVPGHDIPQYLAGADAGICLWEDLLWYRYNPPTKLFEYLVAGLPVFASDIRTHTQYIKHGQNGFVFPYDPDGLAKAIADAIQRREEWPQIAANAWHDGAAYIWDSIEPDFLDAVTRAVTGITAVPKGAS